MLKQTWFASTVELRRYAMLFSYCKAAKENKRLSEKLLLLLQTSLFYEHSLKRVWPCGIYACAGPWARLNFEHVYFAKKRTNSVSGGLKLSPDFEMAEDE